MLARRATIKQGRVTQSPHLIDKFPLHLGRVLRTVFHLKPSQIWYQALRRFQSRFENPATIQRRIPSRSEWELSDVATSVPLEEPVLLQPVDKLANRTFCFLNREETLTASTLWDASALPRLWQYNLHYFDWLWSMLNEGPDGWKLAKNFASDWIENHPPQKGATGWEPYPTSLRLINWCLLFLGHWRDSTLADQEFCNQLSLSIWRQYQWLARHVEYNIMANHLLENAVALAVGGRFFTGDFGRQIGRMGNSLCRQQLNEQILADGLHFERSPMYHARVCWLTRLLADCGDDETRSLAQSKLPSMHHAMQCMLHPDEDISLFNDAASRIYSLPSFSKTRHPGPWALPYAGYYGSLSLNGDYIVCDCGEIGPDYQPGHAHADTLSFEWSLGGERFITDTGTLEYAVGDARSYDRSTLAHNTVTIDNQNSSEVWGAFRVGRRCIPQVCCWTLSDDGFELTAEHHGFRLWKHRRTFLYSADQLILTDEVDGKGPASVCSTLHFAPNVRLAVEKSQVIAVLGQKRVCISVVGTDFSLSVKPTRYSPEFGISMARQTLSISMLVSGKARWVTKFQVSR